MTYELRSGHTVTTQRVGAGIEFTTRNAEGETISTVQHTYADAVPLIRKLTCAAAR